MGKKIKDPGMGVSSFRDARRFINQDGSFNVKHINERNSLFKSYNYLITISWTRFFLWVLLGYILVNAFFALLYTLIGVSDLMPSSGDVIQDFFNAFFFSAQTITTVGYGHMSPKGFWVNVLSSFEALIGLLSFSFVTGLLYGRFSKPKGYIEFSKTIVLRKHKGVDCLMFRLMSNGSNIMIRSKVEVTLSISEEKEDKTFTNSFYRLDLERKEISYLPTTWTVVHPITTASPLHKYNREYLNKLNAELMVLVSYYDESFSQEVHQVFSYELKNIKKDYRFEPAFYFDEDGIRVLDHNKLDQVQPFE